MGAYSTLEVSRKKALEIWKTLCESNIEPTDKQLEGIFENFCLYENLYNCSVNSYTDEGEDDSSVESYVESEIRKLQLPNSIPFTFAHLKRKIEWDELCDIIGVDYYNENKIQDTEVFDIEQEIIQQYNL